MPRIEKMNVRDFEMPPLIVLSEEEEKYIAELYKSGVGFMLLYNKYGYSAPVVKRALAHQNVPERRRGKMNLSEELIQQIIELYQSGIGAKRIGKMIGHSQKIVQRVLEENGFNPHIGDANGKKPRKPSEIPEGAPIDCNTEGLRCIYRNPKSTVNICDYCIKTGKIRGGSPTECVKYKFK